MSLVRFLLNVTKWEPPFGAESDTIGGRWGAECVESIFALLFSSSGNRQLPNERVHWKWKQILLYSARSIFDVNISKLGLHYKRLGHVFRTPVRPVLVLRFLACQFFMTRFLNLRINRYFENEKLHYKVIERMDVKTCIYLTSGLIHVSRYICEI